MGRLHITCLLSVAALATLAACKTEPVDRAGTALPERARYMPYVGAPITSFSWMMRFDSWEALSDSELVMFINPDTAYYLKIAAPCGRAGLGFAHVIGLTSSVGGAVIAHLNSVRTEGMNCQISEIRTVDYTRMREDARALRVASAPSTSEPAATPAEAPIAAIPTR